MVFTKTILKEGTGDGCQTGNKIKMHYTGWVKDTSKPDNRGSKFDSSHDRGPPFEAKLDVGQLIKGWDKGVLGMKLGEKALLDITSDDAYGARAFRDGKGDILIPANADLLFEIELMGFQ